MKLFKSLLIAPATLGLLAPISASANEVNLNDISSYSDAESIEFANSFKKETKELTQNPLLLAGGEGLVDSHDGGFSSTTSASFSADFVVGAVDGANNTAGADVEAVSFDYQYGMSLTTSFTGDDSLDLVIETGNGNSASATTLDMNSMADVMTLDGITYTFPLGDKTTIMVGDCGSGNAAGLGGGSAQKATAATNDDSSSATIAASYDFGNGFTVAGGLSGAGGDPDGLFTKETNDVYGIQAAYNTDSYGVSVSYALTDTGVATETTYWGLNGFYTFEGEGLPSISVGYESQDPSAGASAEGYFAGLTWDEVGPGSFSVGLATLRNFTDAEEELYVYEASYSYPITDGMTITPGVFIGESAGAADDLTGFIVKTSFSF